MKDIRGYRQNDIDKADCMKWYCAICLFLSTIEMGSNYEKSRDALSHPSGDR